jgi:hypothetical protein
VSDPVVLPPPIGTHFLATAHWTTDRKAVMDELEQGLDLFIGDNRTGCIVVTFDGPMGGDEAKELKIARIKLASSPLIK